MQQTIKQVCEELTEFLLAKNKAYGDSASDPVRIFSKTDPLEQINIRIDDKLSRIARGNEFDGDDTELDLIGYLVLKRAIKRKHREEGPVEALSPKWLQRPQGVSMSTETGYRNARAVPGVSLDWDILRKAYPYDPDVTTIILVPAARRDEVLALRGAVERSGKWGIKPPKNVFAAVSHLLFGYLPGEPSPEDLLYQAAEDTLREAPAAGKPHPSVAEMNAPWITRAGEITQYHAFANDLLNKYAAAKKALHETRKERDRLKEESRAFYAGKYAGAAEAVGKHVGTVLGEACSTLVGIGAHSYDNTEETLRREAPGRSGYQVLPGTKEKIEELSTHKYKVTEPGGVLHIDGGRVTIKNPCKHNTAEHVRVAHPDGCGSDILCTACGAVLYSTEPVEYQGDLEIKSGPPPVLPTSEAFRERPMPVHEILSRLNELEALAEQDSTVQLFVQRYRQTDSFSNFTEMLFHLARTLCSDKKVVAESESKPTEYLKGDVAVQCVAAPGSKIHIPPVHCTHSEGFIVVSTYDDCHDRICTQCGAVLNSRDLPAGPVRPGPAPNYY